MIILVTGSEGFVGLALRNGLIESGHSVMDFDIPQYNILKLSDLDRIKHADMVVHSAAIANLNETAADPFKTYETNVRGTYNVAMKCKELNKRLIYISTCCVYGPHSGMRATESLLPLPIEFYARSKLAGEPIAQEARAISLRLGTVYGPGMRDALFNSIVLRSLRDDKPFEVFGDGSASRNYIYIDDLVDAIVSSIDNFDEIYSLKSDNRVINLAGDEIINLDDVVEVAEKVTGRKANFKKVDPRDMGDYQEDIVNFLAKRLLFWSPGTNYEDGMRKTWEWLLSKKTV